jgi:hypothetical protein
MWFITSSGSIQLNITKAQAEKGYHQGDCDRDIDELRKLPAIRRQLSKLKPEDVRRELRGYGAWDAEELGDHEQNLNRLLWLACGDIADRA